jgi:hypothetical protein
VSQSQSPAPESHSDPSRTTTSHTHRSVAIPAVVVGRKALDQSGDLGADPRPSCAVGVGPLLCYQAAVPAQEGAGVTSRRGRSPVGRRWISAASTARSAQSRRGRGLVPSSTATSCSSTKISQVYGVGPVIAAIVPGATTDASRFVGRDHPVPLPGHPRACTTTARSPKARHLRKHSAR